MRKYYLDWFYWEFPKIMVGSFHKLAALFRARHTYRPLMVPVIPIYSITCCIAHYHEI
jgi:hypothetical protein